ncbi:hypothetical protein PTSG_00964 [Salpingoeca rosetta]|uniref:EF-hand domain-containing protein n=1 Tax=Salpingoeca rosetta (strain ATCC 50818 / BSB-021) TaxID=946362 RepID=F2TY02_SALR5|nr:uncharacterized protein PTSG_00964 [Salpingoeca rosetta]EGD76261.1 hypothetical protein PTSG_00964 [Salpingoeca rosetta]|eukprot:XP_004998436.1 hypothetical protein PTSG_00964 [Salpingoeca rosetta]
MGNVCATSNATATKTAASEKPKQAPAEPKEVAKPSAAPAAKKEEAKPAAAEQPNKNDPVLEPGKVYDAVDAELVRHLLFDGHDQFQAMANACNDLETMNSCWLQLDQNNNGIVSLSEIKKFVQGQGWDVSDPALMQAYKYATARGDDFVQRKEFPRLVRGMIYMNRLWDLFDEIDSSDDRRIDLAEFKAAFEKLKYPLTDEAAAKAFDDLDKNDGGMVLFGEFCRYMAKLVSPKTIEFGDDDGNSAPAPAPAPAEEEKKEDKKEEKKEDKKEDEKPAPYESVDAALVRQLLVEDDDDLKTMVDNLENKETLKEWWGHLDHNNNGIVSLAEIKKFVQDKNWKVADPALMQAYKYATARGDDFVQRKEFPRLVRGMIYMNRLWDLFDEIDSSDDRRIDLAEFKAAFEKLKYPLTDEAAAKAFDDLDKNDGGMVLFGEFCRYMAKLISPKAVDFDDDEEEEKKE